MSSLGHSVRLARIDFDRMLRKNTDFGSGASAVVGTLMFVVLVGGMTVGGGYLAWRVGQALATGDVGSVSIGPFSAIEAVRGMLALFWLVLTLVIVVRAVGQRGTLTQPEGILTVVPTREALVGLLLAEYSFLLVWSLLPATAFGVGLAVGSATPWPVLAVPVAVAAASAASVAVAYPLGIGIRHVATRFAFVARNKGAIVVALVVAYFISLTTGAVDRLMIQLFEPMQSSPVGWYADLLLVGTPGISADATRAGGAIVLTLGLAGAAVLAGTWVAERHWFSDPALAGKPVRAVSTSERESGIEARLEPVFGPATAALIVLSWRRARRSPMKLLYAFYPLLLLAGVLAEVVQTGQVPTYLPYATVLFAAWAAGVIFTLNPLGDQGAALASTLLSGVDGRAFVKAHVLAGLVVAVPVGIVLTAVAGYLSPVETETVLVLVAATPVVMVVSAALSVGIGMAFPKFEATNVTRSMKTVLPSLWAFALFSLHLFATALAATMVYEPLFLGLVAGVVTWALPFGLTAAPRTLYWVAAVALVALLLAPVVSYRYAVDRFDGYTLA